MRISRKHTAMATVVPCASCYGLSSLEPLKLLGRGPRGGGYLSLFIYRGPRCAPRPRLTSHAPRMTLRQICRMLRLMKQVKNKDAAAAAAAATSRKQAAVAAAAVAPPPASASASPAGAKAERRCVPSCLRHKRNIKRAS